FVRAGRFAERAAATAALLDVQFGALLEPELPTPGRDDYLEWVGLLRCCAAFETYCKAHSPEPIPSKIAEFLLLDPAFPHSVRYSVEAVEASLAAIAESTGRRNGRAERLAGRLRATLSFGQIDEIMSSG